MQNKQKITKKLKLILLVVLAVIILSLIAMGISAFLSRPIIVEARTYSEVPGFSFKYPVFKGWEVENEMVTDYDKSQFSILFKNSTKNGNSDMYSPRIDTSINHSLAQPDLLLRKNSAGASFNIDNRKEYISISFILPIEEGSQFSTKILDVKISTYEKWGFSAKQMANTIIETATFNVNTSNNNSITTTWLSQIAWVINQDGSEVLELEKLGNFQRYNHDRPEDNGKWSYRDGVLTLKSEILPEKQYRIIEFKNSLLHLKAIGSEQKELYWKMFENGMG